MKTRKFYSEAAIVMGRQPFTAAFALATISFSLSAYSSDNTVTYGGKTYKTVKIGTQTWMAENLNQEAEGSEGMPQRLAFAEQTPAVSAAASQPTNSSMVFAFASGLSVCKKAYCRLAKS